MSMDNRNFAEQLYYFLKDNDVSGHYLDTPQDDSITEIESYLSDLHMVKETIKDIENIADMFDDHEVYVTDVKPLLQGLREIQSKLEAGMMCKLQPSEHDDLLFFRLDGEAAERFGAIGYLRADFGRGGNGFYTTWFDSQPHLKTSVFKAEFDNVINSLRDDGNKPPFASRRNLIDLCADHPGKELTTRGGRLHGADAGLFILLPLPSCQRGL